MIIVSPKENGQPLLADRTALREAREETFTQGGVFAESLTAAQRS